MTFSFKPATVQGVACLVAIAGGSRTGKTYSALRLARGLAGGKRFAAVDTEGRRMSHYSADFEFDVHDMQPPFSSDRFVQIAKDAEDAGYPALVIDSFSLEWSGTGGVLDVYDQEFAKRGENPKLSDTCWRISKKPHRLLRDSFMQRRMPIILCMRANEVAPHLGGGWKVEQDARLFYEWTVALTLHPDSPGKPRYDLKDSKGKPLWKVQEQHKSLFRPNELITEAAGEGLALWRNSADAVRSDSAPPSTYSTEDDSDVGAALTDLCADLFSVTTTRGLDRFMADADVQARIAIVRADDLSSQRWTTAIDKHRLVLQQRAA